MRQYELMVVLSPDLGEEGADPTLERVQELIAGAGGKVTDVDEWGLRRLAYEIDDHRDGYYTVIHFDSVPSKINELERGLRLTESIMRFLVVRLDED